MLPIDTPNVSNKLNENAIATNNDYVVLISNSGLYLNLKYDVTYMSVVYL